MNRRGFFKGLLSVAAVAIVAPFIPAQKQIAKSEVDWIHTFPGFGLGRPSSIPLTNIKIPGPDAKTLRTIEAQLIAHNIRLDRVESIMASIRSGDIELIHPFDLHELVREDSIYKETAVHMIWSFTGHAASGVSIIELDGKRYLQTTIIPPITKSIA